MQTAAGVFAVLGAFLGFVAVFALLRQRRHAEAARGRVREGIVISGGNVEGLVENSTDLDIGVHLERLAVVQRPGSIVIMAAALACACSIASAVLGLCST